MADAPHAVAGRNAVALAESGIGAASRHAGALNGILGAAGAVEVNAAARFDDGLAAMRAKLLPDA
jgi:hypothetical protein